MMRRWAEVAGRTGAVAAQPTRALLTRALLSRSLLTRALLSGMLLAGAAASGMPAAGTAAAGGLLASATLAGALLAAALLLIGGTGRFAVAGAVQPWLARALRANALKTAYLRITDPDAPGHSRPRAPSAAPAAVAR